MRPIISDLQMEYCEALAAGRPHKATWVHLRGYWSLFKAVGLYSITKTIVEMWRKVSSVWVGTKVGDAWIFSRLIYSTWIG